MGLDTLWNAITKALPAFKTEWPTVIGLMVAALVLGWIVGRFMYGQRIEDVKTQVDTLKSQIALRDDRIALSASPEEARSLIAALEKRLVALEPYKLTQTQAETFRNAISGRRMGVRVIRAVTSIRLDGLFEQLKAIFADAGWSVQQWQAMGLPPAPDHEDIVLAVYPEVSQEALEMVRSALKAADLKFSEIEISDDHTVTIPVIWLASERRPSV